MPARKNAHHLSVAEQENYKKGVTAMIDDGTYGKLVLIHGEMKKHRMHSMNGAGVADSYRFLPWHRAYLLRMEAELEKRAAGSFIPYLHWVEGGVPEWLADFKPTVNGNMNKRNNVKSALATSAQVSSVTAIPDYINFTVALEGRLHNRVHNDLGYPMSSIMISPSDPIFWMHHAEVDHVWADWQGNDFTDKDRLPPLEGVDAVMDPWPDTSVELLSIQKLGYSYV